MGRDRLEKGARTFQHLVELARGESYQAQGLGLDLCSAGRALLEVLVQLQPDGRGSREQDE